jgi:hypothetical protein
MKMSINQFGVPTTAVPQESSLCPVPKPKPTIDEAKAILREVLAPFPCERYPLTVDQIGSMSSTHGNAHPIFNLSETFEPCAGGYTNNPHPRGQHITIPISMECSDDVWAIEISFSKGDTYVELLQWSKLPKQVSTSLNTMLDAHEERH